MRMINKQSKESPGNWGRDSDTFALVPFLAQPPITPIPDQIQIQIQIEIPIASAADGWSLGKLF